MPSAKKTCETCKFWRFKAEAFCRSWGVCDSEVAGEHLKIFGAQYARSVMEAYSVPEEDIKDVQEVLDFRTRSTFGCVFWERRK